MIAASLAAAAPSRAQDISGDIGLYNKYLDFDLFVLTDEPVVQGALYAKVSDPCSLMAWGSRGVATGTGAELDVGAVCTTSLGEAQVTVMGLRSFLGGLPDASTVSAGVALAGFDLTLERTWWDRSPDGTRIYAGYSFEAGDKVTLHPRLVYEWGYGLPAVLAGGVEASLAISDNISLTGLALAPLALADADPRRAQVQTGIRYSF